MAPSERNLRVIEEFRANGGRVGGPYEGQPMVILHTTGARTGAGRENPLVTLEDGGRLVVFASRGGAPEHPDWYWNLRANPDVVVEFGTETFPARARIVHGDERMRLYDRIVEVLPAFGGYRERTAGIRAIPVIALERTA